MAVPFNIPEEQSEVEVTLVQLHTLLNKLSVAIRQNQHQTANSAPASPATSQRVRASSTSRRSQDSPLPDTATTPNNTNLSELINNLSLLASASETLSASPFTTIVLNRSPRRRTSSESSCDDSKISIMAKIHQDWNQVGVTLRNIADDFSPTSLTKIDVENSELIASAGCDSSVLSKIMPSSISSCSLMTAMICFVGWHIFRAR